MVIWKTAERRIDEPGSGPRVPSGAMARGEAPLLKTGTLQTAIFNSENFLSIATDEKGIIQLFSVGAERMLGYKAIDVVDKITPADISDSQEVIARAKALRLELGTAVNPGFETLVFKASRGIEDSYELTYFRKDGSRFPAIVSVTALRDHLGGIIGYLLIGTDNTARKRVDVEQKQLDQRLRDQLFYTRSLMESNIDAVTTTDPAGIVIDVNKQMEALTGCTRDELIGAPFRNCFTDPERAEAGIRRVLSGSKVMDYELTVRACDGRETVVSYNATTLRDRDRKLQGVFAVVRDVTERKRVERALQDNNVELERAKAAAERANLAKSDFLSSMSHEIRTPMNAILGMADVLWETQLEAEQMHYVEVFRRAGANLLVLINDILDLSKIEAGHLELERVEFDLEEVVDQAIELTAVQTRAKGIVLLSHLSPGVATSLMGDPTRLRQVLTNLLGNAAKFTDSGEIVLTAGNEKDGKFGQIEITVADTGIGIPADKLETIFDNFTQADTSTTREYGGTGLGLGISRRIVEAMGGCLTATSTGGKGSTFRFTARFDPAPEKSPAAYAALEDLHGKRVLLIDDHANNCFVLRETLSGWGLNCDECQLPEEALASLREEMAGRLPYSLAIIDNFMPGMGGFEAAAGVKRIAPDLPIVMLTFDARPGDTIRRAEVGLSGYAVKPVARAQLLRLVCDAMEGRVRQESHRAESVDPVDDVHVKPARILIAEDSPDNRLLLTVYLKGSPYHLTFAADGKAAVDWLAIADFDLILMDVRMPVMDGLAATRAIRALEQERGTPSTPIVALTAHASLQDIERSATAGCNAHLSKPISKRELLAAIEQYRRESNPVEIARPPCAEPITIEMPPGLEDIVPGYLASRRKEVAEMVELLAASDFERLLDVAHNIKGTAHGYGFPDLSRMGSALEKAVNQRNSADLRNQMTDMGEYLDRVRLVARQHRNGVHAA